MTTPPSLSALVECKRIVEDSFPTSWLDPLLSGPRAIRPTSGDWDGPAVEMLLAAVKDRLLANIESSLPTAPESAPRPDVSLGELPEPVPHRLIADHITDALAGFRNIDGKLRDDIRMIVSGMKPMYLESALRAQSPAEGGFVLVPREPTEAMIDAAFEAQVATAAAMADGKLCHPRAEMYRAMLAAAPTASALRGKEGG